MKSLPTFGCTKDNDITERLKDINYADAYAMQIKICCAKLHHWLCVKTEKLYYSCEVTK